MNKTDNQMLDLLKIVLCEEKFSEADSCLINKLHRTEKPVESWILETSISSE